MASLTAISERDAGYIEGFAAACSALIYDLTGESFSAKRYDPATVDLTEAVIHSYAFNLKDGGRHHPLSDYESVEEICGLLRQETIDWLNTELQFELAGKSA